ncbi:MAG: YfiT family bacillithiol transferase [Gemmatimonadota bacterium]
MSDDLRYPVGKFAMPTEWNAADIAKSRHILGLLPEKLKSAVSGLSDMQLDTPYREGGWTVRQTVHHVADSHLNAYCRFRLALTEDAPTIKPYLEAKWAELADARTQPLAPSLEILDGVHTRLLVLIDSMTADDWQRGFVHPEHGRTMTLWQTAALYAWHSRHHVAHITGLRQRNGWQQS